MFAQWPPAAQLRCREDKSEEEMPQRHGPCVSGTDGKHWIYQIGRIWSCFVAHRSHFVSAVWEEEPGRRRSWERRVKLEGQISVKKFAGWRMNWSWRVLPIKCCVSANNCVWGFSSPPRLFGVWAPQSERRGRKNSKQRQLLHGQKSREPHGSRRCHCPCLHTY